ncbi:MAG TPA: hypothetical protein VGX00_01835 [Thermoplasmata archaeon]|nr:hypothetical protein [Thermoplasmata archaeon]
MASVAPGPVETFRRALEELADARVRADRLKAREAGEKAWLAVVEATDRLLRSKGVRIGPGPRAHVERRMALTTLGLDDLRRTYSDLAESLHGEFFYFDEGDSGVPLDALFEEAARFVEETTGEHGLRKEVLDMEHQTELKKG